ncbi:MAG: hypothetical protein HKO98_15155, partial [Gemmatimonadetes bacterium]|nr:hypothetical protein [Gemmatimonadota bacterium]
PHTGSVPAEGGGVGLTVARAGSGLLGLGAGVSAVRAFGLTAVSPLVEVAMVAVPATAAAFLLWFALAGGSPRHREAIRSGVVGGTLVGGVGFAAGFLGPILLGLGPQGPLMGIFMTGPLGAVIGGVLGALVGWLRWEDPPGPEDGWEEDVWENARG